MTDTADTLIIADHVISMLHPGEVLRDHAVVVKDGRISALLPAADAEAIEAKEVFRLAGHALLPGLVNAHGHAAMSLLRGFADDLPLTPWLEDYIWPVESRHVGPEFVADGTDLALAEMIRAGITCFSDMYFFPDVVAERVNHAGLRCQLTFPIFDFPSAWGQDADDYISKGLALRDDLKHRERIRVVFGPHAPYTVNEAALGKVAMLANELDLPIHIHLHETAREVEDAVAATGQRPLARLHALGLIGPRTQCVHMTALEDDEIDLLAANGAHVVHCPESNMKLASGRCPVSKLMASGVNVALGTDSAASNNNLSLLGEMRSAALLAKLGDGDASVLPAETVLAMATINGARAMGLQDEIGSLEPGKWADIIAVDLAQPETQPLYHPVSQLVYAADAAQVTHSWVAGQCLMQSRELTTLNLQDILGKAGSWVSRIEEGREHE
jgi:5-methylthioadenosine/S-adenosylhomocysteine deaminase